VGTAIAMPRVARSQQDSTLRFVPTPDLSVADPILVASRPTGTHAHLVFDTLSRRRLTAGAMMKAGRWRGNAAETKPNRHRRWAANAVAMAALSSDADRDTLLLIARHHLALASKADQGPSARRGPLWLHADRRPPGAHEVGQAAAASSASEQMDFSAKRCSQSRHCRQRPLGRRRL